MSGKSLRRMRKRLKRLGVRSLVKAMALLLRVLPLSTAYWISEKASGLCYHLLGRTRKRMLRHLEMVYPSQKTPEQLEQIARGVLRNLGRNLAELAHLQNPSRLFGQLQIEVQGEQHLAKAFQKGKGLVFATAHFGNWELLAAYMVCRGYQVNVVARPMHDKHLDAMVNGLRKSAGVSVIQRGRAGLELFRCLRRNEGLGILVDLDTDGDGVFVDFLGHPAYTQTGPISLALRSGAEVVMGLIHREGLFKHRVRIRTITLLRQGHTENEKIVDGLRQINAILEDEIADYPDEWAWMHRRWKRQPNPIRSQAAPSHETPRENLSVSVVNRIEN